MTAAATMPLAPGLSTWRHRGLLVAIPVGSIAFVAWAVVGLGATVLAVYAVPAVAFIVAGMAAWAAKPSNPAGRLLTACGALILIPLLQGSHVPIAYTIGLVADSAFAPVLFYAVFAFPDGRLRSPIDVILVAGSLAITITIGMVAPLFVDPRALGCTDCPEGMNLLLLRSDPELVRRIFTTVPSVVIPLLSTAMIARLLHRLWRATPPMRRVLAPLALATIVWLSAHSYIRVIRELFGWAWNAPDWINTLNAGFLACVPVAMLVGLQRARRRRSRIGDLVVELGAVRTPEHLEAAIARTLGDPTVEVGFWDRDQRRYITNAGVPLQPPRNGGDRAATYVERGGEPLAVIVHDRAVDEEPRLVRGVAAAARFAVENERLQAEVRAQLEDARRSRSRLVSAADNERRRIERDLHDGAQQRLLALALDLHVLAEQQDDDALRGSLVRAANDATSAFHELRELSHGLIPSVLSDAGLAAAVEYLAERAHVPVTVDVSASRGDPSVETTAYYVIAESLANAMKHADAEHIHVSVQESSGRLLVEVVDDGRGGADPAGPGLAGLADRVAAVGGRFTVDSAVGGTRIRADLPCA